MSSVMTLVRVAVAVMSVALCVSPGAAAWICPPPMSIPGPPSLSPVNPDTLMGTDYKISGFNSRLPAATSPATVKFDGIAESVGIYIVNESIRQIVNGQGKRETWIDFEFTQNPLTLLSLPRGSSVLAEDMGKGWRVNLTGCRCRWPHSSPSTTCISRSMELQHPSVGGPATPIPLSKSASTLTWTI